MDLQQTLNIGVSHNASDIVLKTDAPAKYRINGQLVSATDAPPISEDTMTSWVTYILPEKLKSRFEEQGEVDFSYVNDAGQRFRVNLFRQRQTDSIVLRKINSDIKTCDELGFSSFIGSLASVKRGIVLVTGATGSGKSTTLAGIVEKINREQASHIITIEDPIEYWFTDKNATINQREIGSDTQSFSQALRAALRQNPDVILVGELRDQETTETALMAAETGHLVLSTLHTANAVDSISRIMSYFPPEKENMIRMVLSQSLRAVISQRLVPHINEKSMVAAMEIVNVNATVRDIIVKEANFDGIFDVMEKDDGRRYGMQSFDQALISLFQQQLISEETLLKYASKQEDVKLKIRGVG